MNNFNFHKDAKWPGLAKVIEETSEMNIELSKIIMLGGQTNHWKGDVRKPLKEEISDALAAISWFVEHNFSDAEQREIELRSIQKMCKYDLWHAGEDPPPEESV